MIINEKALFIGPYGENKDAFGKLVSTLLEDVVQWRRNFHPNDTRLISPTDKRSDSYHLTNDKLQEEFDKLLGEMKQSIPFHSPRFLGHMHTDLAMPALLGYFIGLLYNQNNVVGESSPVTTLREIAFITQMCEMVGYPKFGLKQGGWGHLCGGGTTANLEAMWVARNIKYYPLSVKLFAIKESAFSAINDCLVELPNKEKKALKTSTFNELFNLSIPSILALKEAIKGILPKGDEVTNSFKKFEDALQAYQVQNLGVAGMHQEVQKCGGQNLELPVVYVGRTAHYCWEKNLDVLGLGKSCIRKVDVDADFRLSEKALKEAIEASDRPILMVVGVVSTTEEGAVDPIHRLVDLRKNNVEAQLNKSFYLHVDGAYGGYFAAMVREPEEATDFSEFNPLIDPIRVPLEAIAQTDSIAIDPHKLGFIPYSAGMVLYANTELKDFIYKGAPYLANSGVDEDKLARTYLGGWTLEGSRSGAAALACALTSAVIPNNQLGYGLLMAKTIKFTKNLYNKFSQYNAAGNEISIIPIHSPDTNLLCYAIAAPNYLKKAEYLNILTERLYQDMSVYVDRVLPDYKYIVSKTEFGYDKYKPQIDTLLEKAGILIDDSIDKKFELTAIRTVIMNPLIGEVQDALFDDFIKEITKSATRALPEVLLNIIGKTLKRRIRILWVENKKTYLEIQHKIEIDGYANIPTIGKYLDIDFYDYGEGMEGLKQFDKAYDVAIVDLNLADDGHIELETGQAVVNYLEKQKLCKAQIIYSKFLHVEHTRNKEIAHYFKDNYDFSDSQLLGKSDNDEADIELLVKAIFNLIQ